MTPLAETLAAVLTPPGHGAIATLAVRGPNAWGLVHQLFRPAQGTLPPHPEAGKIWLGDFGDEIADRVVLTARMRQQYPWIEIHCHGGPEVVRLLLETLQAHGVRVIAWPELEASASGNALQAEALAALSETRTLRTAAILLDQYHGALANAWNALEAATERHAAAEMEQRLAELIRFVPVGRHLTQPWRVVVAGAPNVGKSSLVNALAGFQRCIVSATPGTTRDVVTTLIALDGWPVELADTAGQREATAALEAEGIARARAASAAADLILWVLDASTRPVWPPDRAAVRLVVNKVDLPAAWDLSQAAEAPHLSAATGAGLAEFCQTLTHWLVPDPPPPGAAVPFTPALCDVLQQASRHCQSGSYAEALQLLRAAQGRFP